MYLLSHNDGWFVLLGHDTGLNIILCIFLWIYYVILASLANCRKYIPIFSMKTWEWPGDEATRSYNIAVELKGYIGNHDSSLTLHALKDLHNSASNRIS